MSTYRCAHSWLVATYASAFCLAHHVEKPGTPMAPRGPGPGGHRPTPRLHEGAAAGQPPWRGGAGSAAADGAVSARLACGAGPGGRRRGEEGEREKGREREREREVCT